MVLAVEWRPSRGKVMDRFTKREIAVIVAATLLVPTLTGAATIYLVNHHYLAAQQGDPLYTEVGLRQSTRP